MATYDKVSWHFPDGEGCTDVHSAAGHLKALMRWLKERDLLSEEGREAMDTGVDLSFALTSYMLTDRGNRLLDICYADWVRTLKYGMEPSMSILEDCLRHV